MELVKVAPSRHALGVVATNDRIIVVDPMGEYAPLVRRLGGQVIEIAPDSPHHISPMDLQMNINDEDSPLSMKADFLLSLCELIVGGKEGLQPIEKTVIDRCVRLVYREMALGLETAKTPLLQDLYEELLRQPEPEARRVATALELYCTGSLNLFNHPTNVDLNSRVVCIVLKGLGENLRKIAMHTTNEFVTAAVNAKEHIDQLPFGGEALAAARRAEVHSVCGFELFTVSHDDIVGKSVHAVVERLSIHAKLPGHKGNKNGGRAGGHAPLDLNAVIAQCQRGHKALFLLPVQTAQGAVVFLRDAAHREHIVFQPLPGGSEVHHRKGQQEHSLVAALQVRDIILVLLICGAGFPSL